MALYTITHTCGHDEEIQIYGTNIHGEREAKAARLSATPCAACQAAEARKSWGDLPALTGSDKQIAWASDIRDTILATLTEQMSRLEALSDEQLEQAGQGGGALDKTRQALDQVKSEDKAHWWIEHRDRTGRQAMLAARKELGQ